MLQQKVAVLLQHHGPHAGARDFRGDTVHPFVMVADFPHLPVRAPYIAMMPDKVA